MTGRTFQARLTLAFVAVVALSLLAVSAIVVNRLDSYFRDQEQAALDARGSVVARIVALFAGTAAGSAPVVGAGNTLNPDVASALGSDVFLAFLAIITWPLIQVMRVSAFEGRRWQESMYTTTGGNS